MPVGRCSNCDAAVSYFARLCPHCHAANWPNPVVTVAALAVVVLVGGAIALGALFFPWSKKAPQDAQQPEPKGEAIEDYGWIVKAMAECDEVAKRTLDVLRFLILPLTTTGKVLPGWRPNIIGTVGDSIWLVSATDALIGLRNGAMVLYPTEVTFAVSDPKTNTIYKWKPAAGVSELTTRETGFDALKLGFQVADHGSEIAWGPTIKIATGTCYWTNPIIRPAPRK
jgi:hypothetical protein